MNAAFKKAHSTLDNFLAISAARPDKYKTYGAYIKIEDKGEVEYLWVVDVKPYKENHYIGVIISTPRLVSNVKYGQTIAYVKDDIFDWQLQEKDTGIINGAFTICAMLNTDNKQDAEYIAKGGFQCGS